MRLMLGLDAPDRGAVLIAGRRYRELGWPLREVGAGSDRLTPQPLLPESLLMR